MLTYRLVLPSVAYLKISGILGVLPLQVTLRTGHFDCGGSRTTSTTVIRLSCYASLLVKVLQLLWSIHQLGWIVKSSSHEERNRNRSTIVIASMMICMILVCIAWNAEFWRHKQELLALLRFLHSKPQKAKQQRVRWSELFSKEIRNAWQPCRSVRHQTPAYVLQLQRYLRLVLRDLYILLSNMTLKDFCVIMLPFGVKILVPLLCVSVWLDTPHHCLAVSVISAESAQNNTLLRISLSTIDCLFIMYMALTFHAGIYTAFFVEACCMSRLKTLVGKAM